MKYNRRKFIKTGSILIGSYSVVKASEPWFDKKSKVWDEIRETTLSNLRCEYLTDPLGIDTDHPRFSWEIIDFRRAVRQTAYQVLVASSLKALKRDEADLWDTGRVESDVTIQIEYNGKPLASSTVCFWKVRVWTTALKSMENGSDWSKPALFSVGLLQEMDWKAKWITAPDFISDSPMHVGYMSLKVNDPNDQKWVQIDLVTQKNINGIRLHRAAGRRGVYPNGGELSPSYDFPLRFKIEVSDYEDMSVKSMVSDYTKEDVVSPEKEPFNIRFTEVKGRYVRLTSLKQRVVLKLAGMEVLHGETDLAKGCKATALDSYEDIAAGFGISLLTAGKTQYDGGSRRRLRPAPLLRGEFVCKKPVKRAITYSTALGNYELRINGTRISDTYMAPGYTQYNKRVPIQTFDVTSVLHEGANAAGAILADGWYRSRYRLDGYDQFKDFAQGRFGDIIPRFLLQIEIEYEDGTREITGTNETWSYTFEGPYRKTSMYDGIIYDSRCELPGWNEPGYHGEGWKSTVVSKPAWKLHLWPQTVQPIICRGKFKPLSLKQTPSGNWICDFGQGVGGVCRVTLDGAAGTKVKLRHAMALNEDGSLYTKNLWGAYDNGDVYILAGKGPQTFTPDFTFHGFRYVEISGLVSSVNLIDITALMISDSCPVTANFETSDLRLNKLWSAVSMTFLSCLKSSMADVADRDERWGWMGDCGSTLAQSMTYNFDTSTYFRKRCLDMMDDQWEDGHFPSQSPEMDGQRSCIWSDAVLTMAWTSWLNYGDKRLLNETFPAVRKYIYLLMSNYEKGTVLWPEHNGDWLSAFMTIRPGAKKWGDLGEGHISKELIQRIDLIYITKLFRDIADVLGKRQDSETAEAFVSKLFSDPIIAGLRDKEPETGAQTAYALSLGWNAAKPDEKPLLMEKLLNAIELKGGHVTTGTISTLPLLNVLSGNGHHELAYRLAMKPEFPSFGFMVDQGATVLWERFDGYIPGMGINPSPMNGLNHVGFAAVSEWIFGSVGGIRPDPLVPGYKHFSIAPRMGGKVTWAKSDYNSVRGKIACDWKVEGATFSMHVVVPPNTTATIYMPTKDVSNVKEGELQLKNASCATFLHVENGCAVFNVESGEYWFSSYL